MCVCLLQSGCEERCCQQQVLQPLPPALIACSQSPCLYISVLSCCWSLVLSDILSVSLIVSLFLCLVEWLEVCSLSGHLSHSNSQLIVCDYLWSLFWQRNILRWILTAYEECVLFLSDVLKALSHKAYDYMLLHHVLDFLYRHAEHTAVFLRSGIWVKAKNLLELFCFVSPKWDGILWFYYDSLSFLVTK